MAVVVTTKGRAAAVRRMAMLALGLLLLMSSADQAVARLALQSETEIGEYCFPNVFNATCGPDEVILMHGALYGRMRQIACLTSNYHIGCHADVLGHVDRMCSGRHHCMIKIPDTTLHSMSPCPSDMMAYLEASYTCVRVESGEGQNCRYPRGTMVSRPSGYLANIVTETVGFGSPRCPWVITLPQGQRINITLLDFGVTSRGSDSANVCHVYAKIKEKGLASDVTICGSMNRQKGVYISEGNSVEVHIMSFRLESDPTYFLMKYEGIGCTDPAIPQGAWYKRTEEKAVVSCNYTSQIWHIICHGNRWVGKMDNCTIPAEIANKDTLTGGDRRSNFPYGLLVAIITGVLLGILIGVAMLAVVLFVHRRRRRRGAPASPIYSAAMDTPNSPYLDSQKAILHAPYGYTHMYGTSHSGNCSAGCPLHSPSVKSGAMTSQDVGRGSMGRPHNSRNHTYEKPGYKRDESFSDIGPVYHEFDVQAIEAFQHDMDNKDNDNKYVPEPGSLTD